VGLDQLFMFATLHTAPASTVQDKNQNSGYI
jgi:hypothetical protein